MGTIEQQRINVYQERNQLLKSMGFTTYKDYLGSRLWRDIRARVLTRNRSCYVCGDSATEAHHQSYARDDLDGTRIDRIFSICRLCHKKIEFRNRDGEKLTPAQATAKMKSLRTNQAKSEPVTPIVPPWLNIDDYVMIDVDSKRLVNLDGEYASHDIVTVGDLVVLQSGVIGKVIGVRADGKIPRFIVGKKSVGRVKIRAKLVRHNLTW